MTDQERASYGFRFQERSYNYLVNIWNIGWEILTSTDYYWDGNNREEIGKHIFQYTLSGSGEIKIEGKSYSLQEGQAFLVSIPSNHRYFFPENSDKWECIFLTLYGHEAEKVWSYVTEKMGPIIDIPVESSLIDTLFSIYKETRKGNVQDAYYASALAYKFLMECVRFMNSNTNDEELPEIINDAKRFMEEHLHCDLSLEDICEEIKISKYYFIKLYKRYLNETPMHYLTRLRVKKAMYLLMQTDKTINEIAEEIGFKNGNYFNKVFKKALGVSAGEFRKNKIHK